jgi:hypothetical protein
MTDIVTITPIKITYSLLINVHYGIGGVTNSVRIATDAPPARFAVGDQIWIGGLDSFPERLTMGRVRGVRHTLGGDTLELTHEIAVDVDEDRE